MFQISMISCKSNVYTFIETVFDLRSVFMFRLKNVYTVNGERCFLKIYDAKRDVVVKSIRRSNSVSYAIRTFDVYIFVFGISA